MRIKKLNSKSASNRIKYDTCCLPVPQRAIGVTSIERAIANRCRSVLICAWIQIDARAARWKLSPRKHAVDQSEAGRTCMMKILETLLRHEEVRIHCRIVRAQLHPIKLPRHAPRQQHLLDVVAQTKHRLAVD